MHTPRKGEIVICSSVVEWVEKMLAIPRNAS